jgi:CRISPR/Cas system CSM-associated protein Csm2 small subunit
MTLNEFETKEDFDNFWREHSDEYDQFSTKQLNKLFKVKDYKISRIKGEITLKAERKKMSPFERFATTKEVRDYVKSLLVRIVEQMIHTIQQLDLEHEEEEHE